MNHPTKKVALQFSRSLHKKYKREGYGKAWSMNEEGLLKPNEIVDIRFAGVRQTYRITTESGKTIVATDNHKFPTSKGIRKLSDLAAGDKLFVFAGQQESAFVEICKGDGKSNLPVKGEKGFQTKRQTPYKLWIQNSPIVKERAEDTCELCGEHTDRIEVHHKDMNRLNNILDNLVGLCASCHKKAHYA
jgi:5-methylcytosine-specific restriction endonuclease McrA